MQGGPSLPTGDISALTDSLIEEEIALVTSKMKGNSTIKILQKFGQELKKLETNFDLKPISESIKSLSEQSDRDTKSLMSDFEKRLKEVKDSIPSEVEPFNPANLVKSISDTKKEFVDLLGEQNKDLLNRVQSVADGFNARDSKLKEGFQSALEELRKDLLKLVHGVGGGNMNRQVKFNGTDSLTKYTDINWKAGNNVSFTVVNNNSTKMVDVTINATGGSGSGITRSINSVAVDTAAGAAPTVDYVYLVTGTTRITLPDAAANTNLYTVKNVGVNTVTVDTTSSQTIDGSLTITLPVRYTSVDIESDGTNWNVT